MKGRTCQRLGALLLAALAFAARASAQEGGAVVEEPVAPAASASEPSSRVLVGAEVAYAHESLYTTPINGLDVALLFGAELRYLSVGAMIEATPGWTPEGLHTFGFDLGAFVEGHAGRFRLGGGLRVGRFSVARATFAQDIASATSGVFGRVSFDVIPFGSEGSAAYLVGKVAVDDAGTPILGGTIGIGVRY